MRKISMRILLYVICFMAAVLVAGYSDAHEGHKAITTKGVEIDAQGRLILQPQAREAIGLKTVEVTFGDIRNALILPGELILDFRARSFSGSLVEGLVDKINVRPGQFVKEGEVLAIIRSIELESLQRELLNKTIRLGLIRQELKRAQFLGERIVSGKDSQMLESEREITKVSINSLSQKLRALGINEKALTSVQDSSLIVDNFPLLAPQSGYITELDITVGRQVETDEHLVEIHDTRHLAVDIKITEDRIGLIRKGQPIRLKFSKSSEALVSTIDIVLPVLNKEDGMFHAYAVIDNSNRSLRPGMFGQVEVELSTVPDAFLIPKEAVVTDGAERYCFVELEEGVYKMQNLVLGLKEGNSIEVLEGVYPGDRVITAGNYELAALFVRGVLSISEDAAKNIALRLEEIDIREIHNTIRVNGRVVPLPGQVAEVALRVSGKVHALRSTLGQYVNAGDKLADIHSLELVSVQLDLIKTAVRLQYTEHQVKLIRNLTEGQMTARKQLLRLESEANELTSRYESLRRTLRLIGLRDDTIDILLKTRRVIPVVSIRAPISGFVTKQSASVGRVVSAGEPLYEITNISTISVEAVLFAQDAPQVLDGGEIKRIIVRAVAYPGREWLAKIELFHPSFAGNDKTLRVWTDLKNEDMALLPGMHLDIHIVTEQEGIKEIAVPIRALINISSKRYVFVQDGETFRRVEVITGLEDAHYAQVIDGLFPGDSVVVEAVNELNNAFSAVR